MDDEVNNDLLHQSKRHKGEVPRNANSIRVPCQFPTLQQMSVVSLAIKLCADSGIVNYLEQNIEYRSCNITLNSFFDLLKRKVSDRLSRIFLPDCLKAQVSNFVSPIVWQLMDYTADLKKEGLLQVITSTKGAFINWTMNGIIDKAATVRNMIKHNALTLNDNQLFQLACKYCLKDCILDLWKNRGPFYFPSLGYTLGYDDRLVRFWISYINVDSLKFSKSFVENRPINFYDGEFSIVVSMLTSSIRESKLYGVKYFWSQATHKEISDNLRTWLTMSVNICVSKPFNYHHCDAATEVLSFLWSQLQDKTILKDMQTGLIYKMLKCLINCWPFQREFLRMYKVVIDYIPLFLFARFMENIANIIIIDSSVENTLLELWFSSHILSKKFFFENARNCSTVIYKLLRIDRIDLIELILKEASPTQRRIIANNMKNVFEFSGNLFLDLVCTDKLESFEVVLRQCWVSDRDVAAFKEYITIESGTFRTSHVMETLSHTSISSSYEKLFSWGFNSTDNINGFETFKRRTSFLYAKYLKYFRYAFAEHYLIWCFETEEERRQFKISFFSESNSFNIMRSVDTICNRERFEKYIRFTCQSSQDEYHVKQLLLRCIELYFGAECDFKLATLLMSCCLDSPEEVAKFKKKLFLSEKEIDKLLSYFHQTLIVMMAKVWIRLKWFWPLSCEENTVIKTIFNDRIGPINKLELLCKKRIFTHLIDCYTDKHSVRV